jgi:hypothetical protein
MKTSLGRKEGRDGEGERRRPEEAIGDSKPECALGNKEGEKKIQGVPKPEGGPGSGRERESKAERRREG